MDRFEAMEALVAAVDGGSLSAASPRSIRRCPAARSVTIRPRFSVNTTEAVVEAAAVGIGVAQLMSYQAAEAIAQKRIAPILQAFGDEPMPVSLVHQPQRVQPLKRRAFLDFVTPRLAQALIEVETKVRST